MFVALKYALDQGKTVEGILKFEKAGTDEVEFPVAAFGPAAPALRGVAPAGAICT